MKWNIKQVSVCSLVLVDEPHLAVIVYTDIIEDLGSETGRVDIKIQRETRRIEKTTQKSGNFSKSNVWH